MTDQTTATFATCVPGTAPSYTLAVIKPDAYAKGFLGSIIGRIQDAGFVIEGMHHAVWETDVAADFYRAHRERPFFNDLVTFATSGPCVSLILNLPESLTDEDAVAKWRTMMGATDPTKAATGTIRRIFGSPDGPMMHNAVHGSDSANAAMDEMNIIAFGPIRMRSFAPRFLNTTWRARRT